MSDLGVSDTNDVRPVSERVRVRRRPGRGSYDIEDVRAIFDEALLCRVAFVDDGHPFVLPTMHVRRGDVLYVHGARTNRMLKIVGSGVPVTVEATVVDSLVLGRSVFQNSMNYRSAVVVGEGHEVTGRDEKIELMNALVDRMAPGRRPHLRPLADAEIDATRLVAVPIAEFSAKARSGPAGDKESDHSIPVWAGEVPLTIKAGEPRPDPQVPRDVQPPDDLLTWGEGRQGV